MLTKSKYLNGLQCHRLLWFADRKQLPEPTLSDEHKFSQGYEFERIVKQLYPDAVDLAGMEFKENLEKTKGAVEQQKPIFEASFMTENLFVRSDLILPNGNTWDLYEIKSTTQLKPQHIPDLAFQKYVLEKNGLQIDRCFVIYLNKEYIRNGKIVPQEIFKQEEVTDKVNQTDNIKENINEFIDVINKDLPPDISICKNCNKPYECALKKECWDTLPENNVLQLTNWRVYWKLFDDGIVEIKDIPEDTRLTEKDKIIVKAANTHETIIAEEEIKNFLDSLNYPLYHFDFETFDTAVPLFENSRPYQKIPFQYSLHIEQKDGTVEHREFLADGDHDPRPVLLNKMKEDLAGKGDIIVFNKSFEINVMKKLAEDFPEHNEWLQDAISRIVDLADPFKKYLYYNPKQKGSYSIKKVLPAVTGESYENLGINNGGDASMMFFYSHIRPKLENKEKIREDLLKYCCLDTEGMVWIVKELRKLIILCN